MDKIIFPTDLLDLPEIANLESNLKLLLIGCCAHKQMTACGVICLTDYVFSTLGFLPSVGQHVAAELHRRDIAVYSKETSEFFLKKHFHWHKTISEAGENSPWSKLVTSSLLRVRDNMIKSSILDALASAPLGEGKLQAVLCPTNLLSSLPSPGYGKRWSPAELLIVLVTYSSPIQSPAGCFVADFDSIGALTSVPAKTVEECYITLDACCAGAIMFDRETREVFCSQRLKNAGTKKLKDIAEAVDNLLSRRLKNAAKKLFLRTFRQIHNKSNTSAPVDSSGCLYDEKSREKIEKGSGSRSAATTVDDAFKKLIDEAARVKGQQCDESWDRGRISEARTFAETNKLKDTEIITALASCRYPSHALPALQAAVKARKHDAVARSNEISRQKTSEAAAGKHNELVGKEVMCEDGKRHRVGRLGVSTSTGILPLNRVAHLLQQGEWVLAA